MLTLEKMNADARREKRVLNFADNCAAEDQRLLDAQKEWCKRHAEKIRRHYAARGEEWSFEKAFGR